MTIYHQKIVHVLLLVTVFLSLLQAQEVETDHNKQITIEERQQKALQRVARFITETESLISKNRKLRQAAKTPNEQAELTENILTAEKRLKDLRIQFLSFATRINEADIQPSDDAPLTLNGEIREILKPVLSELKEVTSEQRELEELRRDAQSIRGRLQISKKILEGLSAQLETTKDAEVKKHLNSEKQQWTNDTADLEAELDVLNFKIADFEKTGESVLEGVSQGFKNFLKSRGKSLLFAFLAFVVVFLVIRRGYALFRKINPIHRKKDGSLFVRALDLLISAISFLAAAVVSIFILYLSNDWVLLVGALLVLSSIAWAGKHAIPKFFDQAKLILNFGPVREGERVTYNGVPWKVGKIQVYTEFINPALLGGKIRIPINQLMDMQSRPHKGELWFPCAMNDWVSLSDGSFGKIIQQTPETVQMLHLGGAQKIIPTSDFLALHPENFCKGFRISTTFGLSYDLQSIALTKIPVIFEEAVKKRLEQEIGSENIERISVQFKEAGASTLDYIVMADLAGDAAARFKYIGRLLQAVCVEVCNENDWEIPFSQLTIHQS